MAILSFLLKIVAIQLEFDQHNFFSRSAPTAPLLLHFLSTSHMLCEQQHSHLNVASVVSFCNVAQLQLPNQCSTAVGCT